MTTDHIDSLHLHHPSPLLVLQETHSDVDWALTKATTRSTAPCHRACLSVQLREVQPAHSSDFKLIPVGGLRRHSLRSIGSLRPCITSGLLHRASPFQVPFDVQFTLAKRDRITGRPRNPLPLLLPRHVPTINVIRTTSFPSTSPSPSAPPMDYSASVHDADHPTGASPWGNSPAPSPQAHRTTFGAVGGEPPVSPPAFGSDVPSNGFAADHEEEEGFGPSDHGFGRPSTSSTVAESDTQTNPPETASGAASPGQHHGNVSPLQPHDPNRLSGDTARASQEQPQIRKPTQPVYKLQAKITGLERAARKDPILRFDVHVCLLTLHENAREYVLTVECCRPTFQSSEPPSSEMSDACTQSL